MKKLLQGILDFRRRRPAGYAKALAELALGQTPDALLICCSDSRVAPNVFASVEPGDLLVVRNVGNLVPPHDEGGTSETSVAAAIELAVGALHVEDVIVCGHSGCAAMRAVHEGDRASVAPPLAAWLKHGEPALRGLGRPPRGLTHENHLSQQNTLLQLENLRTYPAVREAETIGTLRLHAWWFDIARAEVQHHDEEQDGFVPLDDASVARLLMRL